MRQLIRCVVLVALLTGCAGVRPRIYNKPDGDRQEFQYVKYDCSMKARMMHPMPYNPGVLGVILINAAIDNEFNACMQGYGWELMRPE